MSKKGLTGVKSELLKTWILGVNAISSLCLKARDNEQPLSVYFQLYSS